VEEDPEHGVVLVFELLEGESLIDRLKRTGPIAFDELWPIIEQVWMGLADAHRAGIIHRDLKPSNVFLERRPDGATRVKILDFGISKVPKEVGGETLTEMGQSLGTFSFMPPEQIGKAKTVDHRADIYACATLIYQSLTGQLPYSARNILVMVEMKTKTDARKLTDATAAPVDPRLEAFVARGLSRDPSHRFQTALEALTVWRDLRPSGPVSAQPNSAPPGSGAAARPRSQPPPNNPAGPASPALPRSAPLIVESGRPLPRVHADLIEMTTDETAATLAMPMPHLKKGAPASATPPLAPRLGPAAASIGGAGVSPHPGAPAAPDPRVAHPHAYAPAEIQAPSTLIGPGGTQPVVIGRARDHLGERKPEPAEDLRSGNLPAHPAGSYLPPAVRASLARSAEPAGPTAGAPNAASSRPPAAATPSGLPRVYEDASSSQPGEAEVKTQLYRPADEAARQSRMDLQGRGGAAGVPGPRSPADSLATAPRAASPAASAPAHPEAPRPLAQPARRGVPLVLVLLGFLVVGFVVVAGVMVIFKR
jgi:Protein kinase domain